MKKSYIVKWEERKGVIREISHEFKCEENELNDILSIYVNSDGYHNIQLFEQKEIELWTDVIILYGESGPLSALAFDNSEKSFMHELYQSCIDKVARGILRDVKLEKFTPGKFEFDKDGVWLGAQK